MIPRIPPYSIRVPLKQHSPFKDKVFQISLPFIFSVKNSVCAAHVRACYLSLQSHPPWLDTMITKVWSIPYEFPRYRMSSILCILVLLYIQTFCATGHSYQNPISRHGKFLLFTPSRHQVSHLYLTRKTVALYIFKSFYF
jgi:hypothetical protein